MIAESTFHAPAYSLVESFARAGKVVFKYQLSAPPAGTVYCHDTSRGCG